MDNNDQNFKKEMENLGFNMDDVVNVNDDQAFGGMNEDLVIDTKPKKGLASIFSNLGIMKIVLIAIIMIVGIIGTILSLSYKITTEDVIGKSMNVAGINFISKEYSVSKNDIKVGSTILYSDQRDSAYFGPFLVKYKKSQVSRISGTQLYITQPGTKDLAIINMQNVIYVLNSYNDSAKE